MESFILIKNNNIDMDRTKNTNDTHTNKQHQGQKRRGYNYYEDQVIHSTIQDDTIPSKNLCILQILFI
jgi:hypothetical protein